MTKRVEDLKTFYNCAMAAMYQSILLCTCIIKTLVYESAAYDVNKDFCLETAKRFISWRYRCNFYLDSAENILQDAETCPRKCNVHIDNLDYRNTFSLRQVNITIGTDQSLKWSFCPSSQIESKYMHIDCSSWNKDRYTVIYNYNYPFGNADCVDINNYKICHCYDGYIIVNGLCFKENIAVGDSCVYDRQCTGTANANSCKFRMCTCQTGYRLIDNNCYRGNIAVDNSCSYDWQCTGTQLASSCKYGVCTCDTGYISIDDNCYQGNTPVGYFCVHDRQCTGTTYASLCRSSVCTCQTGYKLFDSKCYKVNIAVDNSCTYDWQCNGTQLAGSCKSSVCTCETGYMKIDNNCYQDKN
nr:prion-like-(Q/N-rich) domain-bearing protein 25 [Crassostrea gigas]